MLQGQKLFNEAIKLRKFGLDLSKFRDENEIRVDYDLKKIGYSYQLSIIMWYVSMLQRQSDIDKKLQEGFIKCR